MSGVMMPEQVATLMPKVRGSSAINPTIHNLFATNASAGTQFRYDGLSQVVFNLPAFKGSWLNPTRTYLRYNFESDTGCFPVDVVTPFERSQLRIGNQVVSDVLDVHVLQKIQSNMESVSTKLANANKTGDMRLQTKDAVADIAGMNNSPACLKEIYNNGGTTLEHQLIDPVLGRSWDGQDKYIPLGFFSGSGNSSAELTMWLSAPEEFLVREDAGTFGYTLTNIELICEVVQMPDAVNDKLSAHLNTSGSVKIPLSIYRLHNTHIPQNTQNAELSVMEHAHDLENIISVIRPQNRPAITDYNGGTKWNSNMSFFGGHGDRTVPEGDANFNTTGAVKSIQWRYDTKLYPQKRLEAGAKDSKALMLHTLNTLDKWDEDSFLGAMFRNGTQWDYGGVFCLVNSFKTSRDDLLNGLNSSATSGALELSLILKKPAQVPLLVQHFTKANYTLELKKGGFATIYNGGGKEGV